MDIVHGAKGVIMSKKSDKIKCVKCCANCKYWYVYDEKKIEEFGDCTEGECRRFPPSIPCVSHINDMGIAVPEELIKGTILVNHPFVFAIDWCGEFKTMKNPRWAE